MGEMADEWLDQCLDLELSGQLDEEPPVKTKKRAKKPEMAWLTKKADGSLVPIPISTMEDSHLLNVYWGTKRWPVDEEVVDALVAECKKRKLLVKNWHVDCQQFHSPKKPCKTVMCKGCKFDHPKAVNYYHAKKMGCVLAWKFPRETK